MSNLKKPKEDRQVINNKTNEDQTNTLALQAMIPNQIIEDKRLASNDKVVSSEQQPQPQQQQQQQQQQVSVKLRPSRPNLKRQAMVASINDNTSSSMSGPISNVTLRAPPMPANLVVPPRRPAHLPASYNNVHSRYIAGAHGPIVGAMNTRIDMGQASSKPANRYAWVQLKHHHPPWHLEQEQAAAAASGGAIAATNPIDHPEGQHHNRFQQHFSSPFSTAASRVLVVNPMHIVNISEHTKSRLVKSIEAVKHLSEKWFSHVLLLLFLAVYACFGAYLFISFEATTEQSEKQYIIDFRTRIINETWPEAHELEQAQYVQKFQFKLEEYERILNRACASGMSSNSLDNQWTFWGALFYSMTVFTTIGYGHLTPVTFAGRVATMIYAIFGIPILLMVLADLGKLLTRIIKFAFKQFRNLYNKCMNKKSSLRTRKLISDNTNQYIGVARGALERGVAYIQPYNDRFTRVLRVGSFRGSRHVREDLEQTPRDDHVLGPVVDLGVGCNPNLNPNPTGQASDMAPTNGIVSTGIILTPVSQTKPVSPPVSNHTNHKTHPLASHHQSTTNNKKSDSKRRKTSSTSFSGSSKSKHKDANKTAALMHRSTSSNQIQTNPTTTTTTTITTTQPNCDNKIDTELRMDESDASKSDEAQKYQPDSKEARHFESQDGVSQIDDHFNGADDDAGEDLEEEDLDIPVSFALFLLVTYMMFGAVVFSIWEGWNFFDSLYFVFISMSTIGFGDLVPQHPKRMIGTFIYLLFGLALTSMCINVVQEKIHATFLRAKMQIGEKMGLDLDQIMADDYYQDGGQMSEMPSDGLDDDSQSITVSQANSSVAQFGLDTKDECKQAANCGQVVRPSNSADDSGTVVQATSSSGVRLSKSSPSLRPSKKRGLASLPGHGNQHTGLLWRKSTRKSTPAGSRSPASPVAANLNVLVPTPTPSNSSPCSSQPTTPIAQQHPFPIVTAPSPVSRESSPFSATCCTQPASPEPSKESTIQLGPNDSMASVNLETANTKDSPNLTPASQVASRPKLSATRSQPTVIGGSQHSLRSQDSQASYKTAKNSPSSSHQSNQQSLNSSRRGSVSHELSQLDELIMTLRAQSVSGRYGPLLGIPSRASARSSLSNSPATQRRAFSTINRASTRSAIDSLEPPARQASSWRRQASPATGFRANHSAYLGDSRKVPTKPVDSANKYNSKSLSGSQAALEEALKAIQSSAM